MSLTKTRFRKKLLECVEFVHYNLARQGVKSENEESTQCLYRGPNGAKCAVGWLIPTRHYRRDIESLSVEGLGGRLAELIPGAEKLSNAQFDRFFVLLGKMQDIHDDREINTWNQAFSSLKKRVSLGQYDAE